MKFKTIKVYNIKQYIENLKFNNEKYTIACDPKIAIIEGINGFLIINNEGCGRLTKNIDGEYMIALIDYKDKYKNIHLGNSKYTHTMTIKEIINNVPYEDILLTDFMSDWKYKKRIKENLFEILGCINKIGLDSRRFCTKVYIRQCC